MKCIFAEMAGVLLSYSRSKLATENHRDSESQEEISFSTIIILFISPWFSFTLWFSVAYYYHKMTKENSLLNSLHYQYLECSGYQQGPSILPGFNRIEIGSG